jgi:hypothetical protein
MLAPAERREAALTGAAPWNNSGGVGRLCGCGCLFCPRAFGGAKRRRGAKAVRGWGAAAPAQAGATSAERVGWERTTATQPDDGTEEGAKAGPRRQPRRTGAEAQPSTVPSAPRDEHGRDAGTIAAKDVRASGGPDAGGTARTERSGGAPGRPTECCVAGASVPVGWVPARSGRGRSPQMGAPEMFGRAPVQRTAEFFQGARFDVLRSGIARSYGAVGGRRRGRWDLGQATPRAKFGPERVPRPDARPLMLQS